VSDSFSEGTVYVITGGGGAAVPTSDRAMTIACSGTEGSELCSGKHHYTHIEIDGARLRYTAVATAQQLISHHPDNTHVLDYFEIVKRGYSPLCPDEPEDPDPPDPSADVAGGTDTAEGGDTAGAPAADIGPPPAPDAGAEPPPVPASPDAVVPPPRADSQATPDRAAETVEQPAAPAPRASSGGCGVGRGTPAAGWALLLLLALWFVARVAVVGPATRWG
jgi:hypothetical protein